MPTALNATGCDADYYERIIEEMQKVAEEEIEQTSQEAVKAAMAETAGELAYQTELAEQYQAMNWQLTMENERIKKDQEKKWMNGFAVGCGVTFCFCFSVTFYIVSVAGGMF